MGGFIIGKGFFSISGTIQAFLRDSEEEYANLLFQRHGCHPWTHDAIFLVSSVLNR
jgi:hypothetical protein